MLCIDANAPNIFLVTGRTKFFIVVRLFFDLLQMFIDSFALSSQSFAAYRFGACVCSDGIFAECFSLKLNR